MQNNEQFPGLGDNQAQPSNTTSGGGWGDDTEILVQKPVVKPKVNRFKKNKKKAVEEFNPDAEENKIDDTKFAESVTTANLYFQYITDAFGNVANYNQIRDQDGNVYELEQGQYVENGQIFQEEVQEEPVQRQQYNNNKPTQQKKPAAKKETKKGTKVEVVKKIKQPKVKTVDEQLQDYQKTIKQVKKYTLQELKATEQTKVQAGSHKQVDTDKQQLNVVFVGHVDHGKSTLSGRVLINSGEIDPKEVENMKKEAEKNGMEGWYLAYAMDESKDERAKGKTVEVGKAFFQLSNRRFTLLDAPGHKNYVPHMIQGACQSDVACLIISARPGEFESGFEKGGQTTEHVQLIRALGVQHIVCVVTKMDQCNWSQERYKQIVDTTRPFLSKVCQFNSVDFIPINAIDDQNISGRLDPSVCTWYDGPSLFEYLNEAPIPKRNNDIAVKLPILDCLKDEGKYYAFGKLEAGTIYEGMTLTVMPNYQRNVVCQEIYDAKDKRIYFAQAGENVKIMCKAQDICEEDIAKGYVMCSTDELCGAANEILCDFNLLDLGEQKQVITSGYQCVLHMHTQVQEIEISEIQSVYDENHKKYVKSDIIKSGQKGVVKISSQKLLNVEKVDDVPYLGRFACRDESQTIAFGTVRKYKPAIEIQRMQKLKAAEAAKKK